MKYKKILFGFLSIALINSSAVYAQDLSISGNGEGSNNSVNISQTQTSTTTQDNNAEINNSVNASANTGNNSADGNTGGNTSISTGDINASTNINNNGINQNSVNNSNCCNNSGANIDISGNGAHSNNSAGLAQNSGSNVYVNNYANISNNIYGTANTGYNNANNNTGGNVSISTGSIKVKDSINNKSINIYNVHAGAGIVGDVSISISGNGAGSSNDVQLARSNNVNVNINNIADVTNNSVWDLNTGNNSANGNTGADVAIATGDIYYTSSIENGPINVGYVDVECCNLPNNPSTPPGAENPGNPGGVAVASSNPAPATTVAAQILPVTGNNLMLFLLMGNVAMFLMGGYLRLRSGRSPNLLFAR
jgi:hypothetical protein